MKQEIEEINRRIERMEAQVHYVIDKLEKAENRIRNAERDIQNFKVLRRSYDVFRTRTKDY